MMSGKSRCSLMASSTTLVITVRFTPLKHAPVKDCSRSVPSYPDIGMIWKTESVLRVMAFMFVPQLGDHVL